MGFSRVKNVLGKLFKFRPEKSTLIAFGVGIVVLLLSIAMTFFEGTQIEAVTDILFRNVLMIFIVGFCFPLLYVRKNEPNKYVVLGITGKKLILSIILNIVFAVLLLFNFISKADASIAFTEKTFFAITYILVAGIFEMVCFYGYIRYYMEKAWGIIPAILITALFYSLHHAGFQPEFTGLFFVGIMYCTIFYITQNIFIIFPFFWGVGAIWDVLIDSTAGDSIRNLPSFLIAIAEIIAMIIFVFILKNKKK